MTPLSQIQVTAVEGGNEEELEGGKGFVLDDMSFLRLVKEPLIIVFPVHFWCVKGKKAISTPREVNPVAIWCSSFLIPSSVGAHSTSSWLLKNYAHSRILGWDSVRAVS